MAPSFDVTLLEAAAVTLYESDPSTSAEYSCAMSVYEDTAFSTWVASLGGSGTDLENYLAGIYSDWTIAYRFIEVDYDGSGYMPTAWAFTFSTDDGAWVYTG